MGDFWGAFNTQLKAELRGLLECYPSAALQAVADGAEENWRILGEIAKELERPIEQVLDFFHAAEHVDEGLRRHAGKDRESATHDIQFWNAVLRDEHKGAQRAREALRYRMNKARGKKKREDIAKQFRYVDGHIDMMNYADLQARNRPIGSGIQEAACKTLFAERLKRSGMSWRHDGGQAIVLFRSLVQTGRYDDARNALRRVCFAARSRRHASPRTHLCFQILAGGRHSGSAPMTGSQITPAPTSVPQAVQR